MTAVWPDGIPQCPILNGLSEQRQRNLAAFAPEVGPYRMYRRSTAVGILTAVAFRMTLDELALFNAFFETTLQDGSLPFEWDHPVTGITYVWIFDSKESPRLDRMTSNTVRITFSLLRLYPS